MTARDAPAGQAGDQRTKEMLVSLLGAFYARGWVSGTGGGICGPTDDGNIFLAPTSVHKELVRPDDFFVVSAEDGHVLRSPADPQLRPSECNAIFGAAIRLRGARSVAHSHALSAVLAGDLAGDDDHLAIRGLEMLKGIRGLDNTVVHLVPVIRNTPREPQLVSAVEAALRDPRFAGAFAVIVRDHGAYIWGADVMEAKRHMEVYHFLFEAMVARDRRAMEASR